MRSFFNVALVALGLLLVLVLTLAAFRLPLLPSLDLLWRGSLGDHFGISRTLVKATPLLLIGLGMVVAWKAGMYNIGGEGQLLLGALAGATVAKVAGGLPGAVLNPLILCASIAGGASYAAIAGWLQVARGVQVVISTILLNFVALQFLDWAVSGPLRQPGSTSPLTQRLPEAAMLQRFDRQTDLHSGVFVALAAAAAVYVLLFLTTTGFQLRVVGENPNAARANRISVGRFQMIAMAMSGALCGLAGGIEYTGIAGTLGVGFSQNWGFLGIPVALLGGLHPVGVLFSALLFGGLFAGSDNLARFTPSGTTLVYVIQAGAVLGLIGLQRLQRSKRQTSAEVVA